MNWLIHLIAASDIVSMPVAGEPVIGKTGCAVKWRVCPSSKLMPR